MKFEAIDGSPVPAKLAPEIRRIKDLSGQHLNSCYRGSNSSAVRILKSFGKMTQAQLYNGWLRHLPGYNPANPPGLSTHELFNDGAAYAVPRGAPLRYWQVGMDWGPDSQQVIKAAAQVGFTATRTYPTSSREYHHLNFRKEPKLRTFKALKHGSRGRRVRKLVTRLRYLDYWDGDVGGFYGDRVEAAVRKFQREHGQRADGIYGIQTHHQLMASYRWHKVREK